MREVAAEKEEGREMVEVSTSSIHGRRRESARRRAVEKRLRSVVRVGGNGIDIFGGNWKGYFGEWKD